MRKYTFTVAVALGASMSLAQAQGVDPIEVAEIGLLPDQLSFEEVSQADRNPFAVRVEDVSEPTVVEDKTESQESKIRKVFLDMEVNGVTNSNGKSKVLLGDMILEKGSLVPEVIANQTQRLIVSNVDKTKIVLSWVEPSDSGKPRQLLIPVNLNPVVGTVLHGQDNGDEATLIFRNREEMEAQRLLENVVASRMAGGGGAGVGSSTGIEPSNLAALVRRYDKPNKKRYETHRIRKNKTPVAAPAVPGMGVPGGIPGAVPGQQFQVPVPAATQPQRAILPGTMPMPLPPRPGVR